MSDLLVALDRLDRTSQGSASEEVLTQGSDLRRKLQAWASRSKLISPVAIRHCPYGRENCPVEACAGPQLVPATG